MSWNIRINWALIEEYRSRLAWISIFKNLSRFIFRLISTKIRSVINCFRINLWVYWARWVNIIAIGLKISRLSLCICIKFDYWIRLIFLLADTFSLPKAYPWMNSYILQIWTFIIFILTTFIDFLRSNTFCIILLIIFIVTEVTRRNFIADLKSKTLAINKLFLLNTTILRWYLLLIWVSREFLWFIFSWSILCKARSLKLF